jgi:enamine deaminase RidA (YjgF/YER057c/UK114 family)
MSITRHHSKTRQVLQKIEKLLGEAGSDTSKILSAQIWIALPVPFR